MHSVSRISALVAIAGLTPLSAAYAQQARSENALEEIIVTAQRREQNLMDVPMSVTAWDGDALERAAISDISLVSDITPGLVASGQSNLGGAVNFYIRGIGSNAGGDPAVGYYIDEIYVGAGNAFNTSFVDLERVEILKGPQGTLWGRNTTGGAINIVTKRPSEELEAEVFAELGEFGTFRSGIAVAGPLSDAFQGRLTVGLGQQDSYTQNILADGDDKTEDSVSVRGQLRFQPSDRLTVDALVGYLRDDSKNLFLFPTTNLPDTGAEFVFDYFDVPPNPDLYTIQLDEQPVSRYRGLETRLDVVYELSEKYRLRWLSGYNRNDSFRRSDFDGNFLPMLHATVDAEVDWTSSELQLQYNADALNWTAGLYYYEENSESFNLQEGDTDFFFMASCQAPNFALSANPAAPLCPLFNAFWALNVPDVLFGSVPGFALPSLPFVAENFLGRAPTTADMSPEGTNPLAQFGLLPNFIFGTGTETTGGYGNLFDTGLITNSTSVAGTESLAAFGQGAWKMTDALTLSLGLRYTEDDKKLLNENLGNLFTPPLPPNAGRNNRDKWTPRAGMEWRPNDDTLLFGTITGGFKGAGFGFVSNITGEITSVDEETVIAYELGYKGTLADGRLRIDTAAYYYDYDDMQITLQYADAPRTDNLDKVEVMGLDFAADWSPTDRLSLGFSFNLTDSEITEFNTTDAVFDPVDFGAGDQGVVGNPLPRAPEKSGYAYTNYTVDLSDRGFLTFGGSVAYTDDYNHSQFGNVLMTPAYTLANANIAWSSPDGAFSVNLFGRNLSDKEYVRTSFFTDAFGVLLFPGAPRTFGVQFRANFR